LYDALEELVARMEHSNLSIELEQTGHETGYSYLVLMTLYRVAQEGLTNVHKYADANEVRIGVNLGAKTATLWVTDTGQGFDVSAWETRFEQEGKTFGLQGLKERLNLVGGELCIHSEQGQGTTLTATVPKQGFQTSVLETASLQLKPHA
ncbi:MAG: ATP-binding protein, partial [Deinococcota bacterium]